VPRLRFYSDVAFRDPDALVDALQPETAAVATSDVEANAVVNHGQLDAFPGSREQDVDRARPRVPAGVVEGFLRHTVETQRDVRIDQLQVPIGVEHDLDRLQALELRAVGFQSGHEPRMLEDARVQLVRQAADVVRERERALLERDQLLLA
jgi:hypothetical protein